MAPLPGRVGDGQYPRPPNAGGSRAPTIGRQGGDGQGGTLARGIYQAPGAAGDDRPLELLLSGVSCLVLRAGWWRFEPGWSQPEHTRPNYTLFVPVDGDAEYVVDGAAYRLRSGMVLLLPPNVPVRGGNDADRPLAMYTVHFHARLYGAIDMPAMYGLPAAYHPGPARLAEIVELARRIAEGLVHREPGCALAVNGDCARLLALLWREVAGREGRATADGAARVAEIVRLVPVFRTIESEYARRLTLAELADLVHLQPAYFSTLFKRVTGLSPLEYLARHRLQHVRELLLSTDRSLSEIAAATGYRDPFYLSRVFRRVQGISPNEYRKTKKSPVLP